MKAFRYNLQSVLSLRRRQENDANEGYARSLLVRRQAEATVQAVVRERDALWQDQNLTVGRGCTATDLERFRQYGVRLEERRVAAEQGLANAERGVAQALKQMLVSRQRREAVERHRELRRAEYERGISAAEVKFLDDLAARNARSSEANPIELAP